MYGDSIEMKYKVTEDGRVMGAKGKWLNPYESRDGYLKVNLDKGDDFKPYFIHRLVAEEFVPNPDNKPCVDHIDGNKLHNFVSNLQWVTTAENNQKGKKTKLTKEDVIKIRQLLKQGLSQRKIASMYGVYHHCIGRIARNEGWRNI